MVTDQDQIDKHCISVHVLLCSRLITMLNARLLISRIYFMCLICTLGFKQLHMTLASGIFKWILNDFITEPLLQSLTVTCAISKKKKYKNTNTDVKLTCTEYIFQCAMTLPTMTTSQKSHLGLVLSGSPISPSKKRFHPSLKAAPSSSSAAPIREPRVL